MSEPSEEVKAMARRCAAKYWQTGVEEDETTARRILSGEWDDQAYTQAALTAILETQRRDAELIERMAQSTQLIGGLQDWSLSFDERQMCSNLATAIRTGTHYGKAEQ